MTLACLSLLLYKQRSQQKLYFFYLWVRAKSLQSCVTVCDPMDYSPPGSSVHGILQARILQWVTRPFSRGSSQPRGRTQVSCTGRQIFFFLPPSHLGNPLPFVVRIKGDHLGGALETVCGTKPVNVSYFCLLSDFCLTHTLGDRASEAIIQTETNIKETTTGKTKFLEIQ